MLGKGHGGLSKASKKERRKRKAKRREREQITFMNYVEERPWWPIKSPNKGRKKKAKG